MAVPYIAQQDSPQAEECVFEESLESESGPVDRLLQIRNSDGGWGFLSGAESRVEPTAWALIAIANDAAEQSHESLDAALRARRFLLAAQLADGSWPSATGQTQGSWATSLACWALRDDAQSQDAADRGMRWLVEQFPREKSFWLRMLRRLAGASRVSAQSDSFYGWSWTAGTSSWVEPTAYACLALRGAKNLRNAAQKRLQIAERMLYDRMCPGGGWNAGNPKVYGVAGLPEIGPTAWALLALRNHADRRENQQSLAWLEQNWNRVPSPAAAALSCIALRAHGRPATEIHDAIRTATQAGDANEQTLWNVPALAWCALALSENQNWLARIATEGAR
jgi:hypothetical protein